MFTPAFFQALDKSNGALTPEVRATVPSLYRGLATLCALLKGEPDVEAPRQLRVDALVEYDPQLQYAGDGTAAHPHQWNREWFSVMPYQATPNRFVIPYYVVTVDSYKIYQPKLDPFDPARYDMPAQDFDVTLGNVNGVGATVSAIDPLTNAAVPVTVVAATPATLTLRVKAVDYPRVLTVTEAKPGPQILAPAVTAEKNGTVTVKWTTGQPGEKLTVSWGRGWENRGANRIDVKAAGRAAAVTIPTGAQGVVAVRITATLNGLTAVWPRWDEDPRGQVVIPGSTATGGTTEAPPATPTTGPAEPLTAPAGLTLPVIERTARYAVALPKGTTLTGPADDREGAIGTAALRLRLLPGAAKRAESYLPFFAAGDVVTRRAVTVDGALATLVTARCIAAQHPGMVNLAQAYLLMPAGDDLLFVTISGDPASMDKLAPTVQAVFAGVRLVK
jgi:hypothetical protein